MPTYQAANGTQFFYRPDFSGEICISYLSDEDAVHVEDMCLPAQDLLEFVAQCHTVIEFD